MSKIINKYNDKSIQIITMPRSGSKYIRKIISLANKTPNIQISEPFRNGYVKIINSSEKKIKTNINYLNKKINDKCSLILKEYISSKYVVKNLIYKNTLNFINDPLYYNILLLRLDLFEMSLSLSLSKTSNNWEFKDYNKYNINILLFKDNLDFYLQSYKLLLELNIKFDSIIFYEDLTNNLNDDLALLDFSTNKKFDTLKDKSLPKEENIINLEELKIFYDKYIKTTDINFINYKLKDIDDSIIIR